MFLQNQPNVNIRAFYSETHSFHVYFDLFTQQSCYYTLSNMADTSTSDPLNPCCIYIKMSTITTRPSEAASASSPPRVHADRWLVMSRWGGGARVWGGPSEAVKSQVLRSGVLELLFLLQDPGTFWILGCVSTVCQRKALNVCCTCFEDRSSDFWHLCFQCGFLQFSFCWRANHRMTSPTVFSDCSVGHLTGAVYFHHCLNDGQLFLLLINSMRTQHLNQPLKGDWIKTIW